MHSSTSNSKGVSENRDVGPGPVEHAQGEAGSFLSASVVCSECSWIKMWAFALVLAGSVLGAMEMAYRSLGHRPTILDDKALWAYHRDHVYRSPFRNTVVCLGDCRMQVGFLPDLLEERFPEYHTVQLAVYETSPMATLKDLGLDPDFNGVVVCAVTARELCKDLWDTQQGHVDYYHRQYNLNVKLNRLIGTAVQEHAVLAHPNLRLDLVIGQILREGRGPAPYYMQTLFDRSRKADYRAVDLPKHQAWSLARYRWLYMGRGIVDANQWLEWALETEPAVKAIQGRGGRVVFVHFPISGAYRDRERMALPRDEFWDRFAARTSAVAVHYEDYPVLARFECPDFSHLDRRDVPRFSLELIDLLGEQGILGRSQVPSEMQPTEKDPSPGFDPFAI